MTTLSARLASVETKARSLGAFTEKVDDVRRKLKDLEDRAAKRYGNELKTAKSNLNFGTLPKELKDIAIDVTKLQKDKDDQESKLEELEDENQELKKKIKTLKRGRGNDDVADQLQDAKDKIKDLKEQLEDAGSNGSEVRKLKTEITRLKGKNEDLKEQLEDAGSNSGEVSRLKAKIKTLEAEKAVLENDNAKLKKDNRDLEVGKAVLKNQVDMYGPNKVKAPNCRGCQKEVYHKCSEFKRWVRFP